MEEIKHKDRELTEKEKSFLTREEEAKEAVKDDVCPHCLQHVSKFPYINFSPINFWVECPGCGVVFAPLSIRKRRLNEIANVQKPPSLLVPS